MASDPPASTRRWRPRGIIGVLLGTVAVLLSIVALASLATDGLQWRLGPIRISATSPSRIALQAALAWLLTAFAAEPIRRRPALVMAAFVAVLVASVADSRPRAVGDGNEYLAMAVNLSEMRPPALSVDDKRAIERRLAATPGFGDVRLEHPYVGRDGRQDFPHFWLYSLVVAPVLAACRALGLHPNHAFTTVNVALVLLLAWGLVGQKRVAGAALLVAGPLIWWIDKAHAEVFLFVTITGAVLLASRRPAIAMVLASLAAAQNPAAVVVLVGVAAFVMSDRRRAATGLALGAALVVAALPAAYYLWHLGTWSPLAGSVDRSLPGLRALLTLVIDPNLGLVPYAPVLILLAALGCSAQTRRMQALTAVLVLGLLVALSRPLNVNHGGSPGMSRYALWLLACLMPLMADGAEWLERRRPLLMIAALFAAVSISWFAFRPGLVDRGGASPSLGAGMLWSRWPSVDNPLPEVFAERVAGVDGTPPVPVAVAGCEKVLIRGDGVEAWWPFPCEPRQAPAHCTAAGALCYVNGQRFVPVPRQPSFAYDPAPAHSWSVARKGRLPSLLARLGGDARFVRLGGVRRVDGGADIHEPFIVEGAAGTAIWVHPVRASGSFLRARVGRESTIEIQDAASGALMGASTVPAGDHIVPLPFTTLMLVVVADLR